MCVMTRDRKELRIPKRDLDMIMSFMLEADKLKAVDRSGWILRGIRNPEHVADHSYSMALLSYIMARRLGLDADKCIIMALTHDINEAITGDIATRENELDQKMSNLEKAKLENSNMNRILGKLDGHSGPYLKGLWLELREKKTKEAQLVDQVDKLDYILQLIHYHKRMRSDAHVYSFFTTAGRHVAIPELLYIYGKAMQKIRRERRRTG